MAVCTAIWNWTTVNQADADLVKRALAGDRSAELELLVKYERRFRSLYARLYPRLHRHLDDCVQEALIRLSAKLHLYRPERGPFGNWATTVARRAFISFLRKHVFPKREDSLDALPEDAIASWSGPEGECLDRMVAEDVTKLEPDQSVAVGGHHIYGLTDKEIASLRRIARRKVARRREQGVRNLGKRYSNSHLKSLRPKCRKLAYYRIETNSRPLKQQALLGGEEGDSE
jgi:RNA polymerase sigma factor (sigma-70 family)